MPTTDEVNQLLDTLVKTFRADLLHRLNGHLVTIYLQGSWQMMEYGKTKLGFPVVGEGPPMKQAVDYAEKHCASLVTKMDEETKSRLAKVISDGIDNKRGVDGLARDIRKEFSDMTKVRSEIIARTESADALEQAFMDRSKDMGIEYKEWIAYEPCDICKANADEGIVPLDYEYENGDEPITRPPQHPACRCALAPARLK